MVPEKSCWYRVKPEHGPWPQAVIKVWVGFPETNRPEAESGPHLYQSPGPPHLSSLPASSPETEANFMFPRVSESPPKYPKEGEAQLKEPMETLTSLLIEPGELTFGQLHCNESWAEVTPHNIWSLNQLEGCCPLSYRPLMSYSSS